MIDSAAKKCVDIALGRALSLRIDQQISFLSMAASLCSADQQGALVNLISFLQAIPDGRYRRGVRYPQWQLLLVALLRVLSGCRSSRDLEAFAKPQASAKQQRHRPVLNQALGLTFKRWPSDTSSLYLVNQSNLQQFNEVFHAWMISCVFSPGH